MVTAVSGPQTAPAWSLDPDVLALGPDTLGRAPRVEFAETGRPGRLIVFDGVDGSGKTTALKATAAYLADRGLPVEIAGLLSPECRELPYFQRYAVDPTSALRGEVDQPSLAVVCLGDRLMRYRTVYRRALAQGRWLLVDRYVFTPLAESMAFGVARAELDLLAQLSGLLPAPDLAFFPQVEPEVALSRIRERPEEQGHRLDLGFHRRTGAAFRALADLHGCAAYDAQSGPAAALARIKEHLDPLIDSYLEEKS
ncbi:hypothetical protein ABT095_35305 [Kitasatospora sp. NPDC002227]|uniref:dTMP kinase n=1 Tax=Kitasatospora sp. NPDC002227 TaxID=3154773 RepID=UPI0033311879